MITNQFLKKYEQLKEYMADNEMKYVRDFIANRFGLSIRSLKENGLIDEEVTKEYRELIPAVVVDILNDPDAEAPCEALQYELIDGVINMVRITKKFKLKEIDYGSSL